MANETKQAALEAEAALARLLVVARSSLWPDDERAIQAALNVARNLSH